MIESRGHSHFEQSAVKQTVGNQFFLTHILFACDRFLSPDCRQEWIIEYCQHQDSDCQRWWADAQTVHNHKQANKLPCSGQAFCKVAISVSLRKIPPNHLKSKAGWQECRCKMSLIDVMLGVEGCSWAELTVLNQYPVPAEQQHTAESSREQDKHTGGSQTRPPIHLVHDHQHSGALTDAILYEYYKCSVAGGDHPIIPLTRLQVFSLRPNCLRSTVLTLAKDPCHHHHHHSHSLL